MPRDKFRYVTKRKDEHREDLQASEARAIEVQAELETQKQEAEELRKVLQERTDVIDELRAELKTQKEAMANLELLLRPALSQRFSGLGFDQVQLPSIYQQVCKVIRSIQKTPPSKQINNKSFRAGLIHFRNLIAKKSPALPTHVGEIVVPGRLAKSYGEVHKNTTRTVTLAVKNVLQEEGVLVSDGRSSYIDNWDSDMYLLAFTCVQELWNSQDLLLLLKHTNSKSAILEALSKVNTLLQAILTVPELNDALDPDHSLTHEVVEQDYEDLDGDSNKRVLESRKGDDIMYLFRIAKGLANRLSDRNLHEFFHLLLQDALAVSKSLCHHFICGRGLKFGYVTGGGEHFFFEKVDVLFVIVEKGRDLNDLMIQKQQKLNLDSQAYKSAHRMVYIQMLVALWENQIFLGSTHHDVKPKNFVHMDLGQGETYEYFNEKGELVKTCATTTVKLIDFNNAVWRHAVSFPSHYGVTTGPYLPPECLFGFSDTPCFQGRDMFSLALVKMEFILGKHPYDFMRDKTLEPPEKFVECLLGKWKNEKKRDHMKRAILPLKRSEQEQYAFIAFACLILIMREGVMEFLAHEFELPDLIKTLVDTKSDEMRFDDAVQKFSLSKGTEMAIVRRDFTEGSPFLELFMNCLHPDGILRPRPPELIEFARAVWNKFDEQSGDE